MKKLNCWEFKKCGREGNGKTACPAVTERWADGVNEGMNGGRVCWAVEGTFCEGTRTGTYTQKLWACLNCNFRVKVKEEMGPGFQRTYS